MSDTPSASASGSSSRSGFRSGFVSGPGPGPGSGSGSGFAEIAIARRSGFDESIHHGAGVVVDPDGSVVASIGDVHLVAYLRSSLKLFQTAAMVEVGLDLPQHLRALAAASHSGEARHLDGVVEILERHGLGVGDLRNTPALPYGSAAKEAAIAAGRAPASLFQNCSGKHAAMLATCRVNGWTTADYLDPTHPLQRHIVRFTEALGGAVAHVGVDGCGAPTFAMALDEAARAFSRLALDDTSVLPAMCAHPELVGGEGRDVTAWMRHVPGLVAKEGAAGAMVLTFVEGSARGRSAVFKIADGSDDARRAVVPAALAAMGVDVAAVAASMTQSPDVPVLGGGRPVGSIDPLPWT